MLGGSNTALQKFLIGFFTCMLLVWAISSTNKEQKFDLKSNSISPVLIKAPRTMENTYATNQLRKEAEAKVVPLYKELQDRTKEAKQDLHHFFDITQSIRNKTNIDLEKKTEEFKKLSKATLSTEEANLLLSMPRQDYVSLRDASEEVFNVVMSSGVKQPEIDKALLDVKYEFDQASFGQEHKRLGIKIISALIRPNIALDEQATKQAKDEAVKKIDPVMIQAGQKIVGESEVVTEEIYAVLNDAGVLKKKSAISVRYYLNLILVIGMLYSFIEFYLYYFRMDLFRKPKYSLLIAMLLLLIIFVARTMVRYSYEYIPITIAAMILTILLDTPLAIIVNGIIILLVSMMFKNDMAFLYVNFIVGTLGSFLLHNMYERKKMVGTGVLVSIVYGALIVSYVIFTGKQIDHKVWIAGLIGITNGVLSIMLTIGSIPFIENIFNIITPTKLLELTNSNHPLLKKMLMEAPGTYNHSLMVGNLAETAVDAVGGNALLARVGGCYHDIGKLHKPHYFTENQYTGNPHDEVSPSDSAYIIMNHVKLGVEEARKHKLPDAIIDFIETHHGTTLVKYFYYKAREAGEIVKEEDYRYKGPKPKTIETGIVMLADTVEAAVRSIPSKDKTSVNIEKVVRNLVQDKIADGQLNECELKFKDINIIIGAFMKVFNGMYHRRIAYPDKERSEERV